MFEAIRISFTNMRSGVFKTTYVGFQNYIDIFNSGVFWNSFRVQIIITVWSLIIANTFPLLAAELLFFIRTKKIASAFKTAFVLPMLVPGIVLLLTWRYMYSNDYGFNSILKSIGLGSLAHNWLNNTATALPALLFIGFPFVSGLFFLIYQGGLNYISDELFEAAVIAGAPNTQIDFKIHIPNLLPYTNVISTLTLIGSLSGFGNILAVTGGGPGNLTMTPAMYMYKVGFLDWKLGYASAMGGVLFVITMALTLITRKLFSDRGAG